MAMLVPGAFGSRAAGGCFCLAWGTTPAGTMALMVGTGLKVSSEQLSVAGHARAKEGERMTAGSV